MIRVILIVIALICGFSESNAQWIVDTLKTNTSVSEVDINFLSSTPIIDGVIDKNLESLPERKFSYISRMINDAAPLVTYRIGYGTEFLYVYIEAKTEFLTFRDRAYQNGDGFLLLICKPQTDNKPADEFYELACSAVNSPDKEWTRHIFWNYNVDRIFLPTSTDTKLEFAEGDGKISFELLLPWTDVKPNHPWLSEGIGFNLTFCKAVEPKGQIWYQTSDDNSGAEFQKRKYEIMRFQRPVMEGKPQTFVSFREGHTMEGNVINGEAITISNETIKENVFIIQESGEKPAVIDVLKYDCTLGLTRHEFTLNIKQAPEGAYMFRWKSQNRLSLGANGLSILPKFDEKEFENVVQKNKEVLSKSSYSTIQFMIQELGEKLRALKIYETCRTERINLSRLNKVINTVKTGIDPFENSAGFIRKAYLSKVDGTLQPYVVYLPENYDKNKKYPLMVYLHGSASDENNIRGVLGIIPKDFIAAGPLGRGKSNAYSRDNAQDDIAEVINAVTEDYNADTTRILLTGFSMGGYGVYRTFYETPNKYKALAVFSGGPNIGSRYAPAELAPDFTDEKNLGSFKNVPIFIFHGEKDLNVTLQATLDFVNKMKMTGAKIELLTEPDKGHEFPGIATVEKYLRWVENVMR
ncbi:MAG: prolyl oligopeptidase family serine peptidase [Ignavibacteria bacterium]